MLATLALAAAVAGVACKSSSSVEPGGDAGPRTSPFDYDASVTPYPWELEDAGSDARLPTLGALPVVVELDVPCVPHGGTSTVLYASDAGGAGSTPVIDRLERVGDRFVAGDIDGFVVFDQDGGSVSPAKTSVGQFETRFASEGATIAAIGSSHDKIHYQRYDAQGALVGAPVTLATGMVYPPGLAMAAGPHSVLAVWAEGRVYAVGAVDGVVAGPRFTVGAAFTNILSTAVAFNGTTFALVWSIQLTPTESQTWFALATPTGLVAPPVEITTSFVVHRVVQIAPTPTGYAVAIDGDSEIYVLPLDASGKALGPAHQMLGGRFTWSLVPQGSELGLLANRADGAPMFRPLDATGTPIGGWVCLDTGDADDAALTAVGSGYAAVYRTLPSYTDVLVRFDRLGIGQ